ncbi:MAG: AGE family epimerase/isomerase [Myxococcota bacterium]
MDLTARSLRSHLVDELLPLWWEHGRDRGRGGFWNALEMDLSPTGDEFKRLRVQTRMLYAFSEGVRMGAGSFAREAADRTFGELCESWWHPGGGGWYRTLPRDGAPRDASADSYELAFVLLGLAHYLAASGEGEARRAIERTLDLLDARLLDPGGLGYLSREGELGVREQNPHLHLLEAFLAVHDATGERTFLERARGVVELARWKLIDPESGTIGERFRADWTPSDAPIEPGHQFEWAWLLERFERRDPDARAGSVERESARLVHFGERYGVDAVTGGVYAEVDRAGRPLDRTLRLWPQLERVHARAAAVRRSPEARPALRAALETCVGRFRSRAHAGWVEYLEPDEAGRSRSMRATSVYHIVGALRAAAEALEESP